MTGEKEKRMKMTLNYRCGEKRERRKENEIGEEKRIIISREEARRENKSWERERERKRMGGEKRTKKTEERK